MVSYRLKHVFSPKTNLPQPILSKLSRAPTYHGALVPASLILQEYSVKIKVKKYDEYS